MPERKRFFSIEVFPKVIWWDIWKFTLEKSRIDAINVTMHLLKKLKSKYTSKCTLVKNHTNAVIVTSHLFKQVIWGSMWKHTLGKNHTNVTNVTMHVPGHAIWGDIWKFIQERNCSNQCNQCDYTSIQSIHLKRHLKIHWFSLNRHCQYFLGPGELKLVSPTKNCPWVAKNPTYLLCPNKLISTKCVWILFMWVSLTSMISSGSFSCLNNVTTVITSEYGDTNPPVQQLAQEIAF